MLSSLDHIFCGIGRYDPTGKRETQNTIGQLEGKHQMAKTPQEAQATMHHLVSMGG